MADEHRRVEAQESIVGSGMLNDPERIRALDAERARRERAWRDAPEKGFSAVLSDTPASSQERIDVYVPRDERLSARDGDASSSGEGAADEDANADGEADDAAPVAPPSEANALPRVPPDPRMAALHQRFSAVPASAAPASKAVKKQRSKKRARREKERK